VLDEKRGLQMIDLTANFPIEIRKPPSCTSEVSNMFSDDLNFKEATYVIKNLLSGSLIRDHLYK
jgi:hypothetical protein